ncbi:MAG TPA: hypothetical protein VG900_03145 [Hyphomicrobiaceae bacterium]|nr:hypothetical protein [Hyphomicrobiaceae bacterium]
MEKSIKKYSDVFGTVLLGMHQDLQAQQQTVDRKIAEWNQLARKRSEEILSVQVAVSSSREEIKSIASDIGNAGKELESAVETTRHAITTQLDAIDAASTRLFEDIRALLEYTRSENAKCLDSLQQLQTLHQAKVEAFARQTRHLLLGAIGIATALVVLAIFAR